MFDKTYGPLVAGRLVNAVAFWGQALVVATLTFSATGSATWVGLVGAALFLPQMILALPMGQFADKHGPKRQIIAGSTICAISAVVLAIWAHVLGPEAGNDFAVALLVTSFVSGVGAATSAPATESIAPKLVTRAELPSAVSLNYIPPALGRTIGPAGGALVATAASPAIALICAACLHLALTAAMLVMTIPKPEHADTSVDALRISGALRAVRQDRHMLGMLLGVAFVGIGVEPALTLAPAIAAEFGSLVAGAGRITSSFGLGGVVGVGLHKLVQGRVDGQREGWVALMLIGCMMGAVTISPSLALTSVAMGLAGASMLMAVTGFSTAIQQICPPAMLGRVMALWLVAFAGIRPFAGLAQGFLADHLSTNGALLITALLIVSASMAGLWTMRRTPLAMADPPVEPTASATSVTTPGSVSS